MNASSFPCYLVSKDAEGPVQAAVVSQTLDDLPEGQVLIAVQWSSLNYKDALAATGHPGVVRRFPHVPGIDAAGVVVESQADFAPGDQVLVTGYELGAGHCGGWAGYIRVPAEWVVRLPEGLSLREAMVYGTAGLTAGLSVQALQQHGVTPQSGEVVVTGATGGVGSLAVMLLAHLGYQVVAVTGKPAMHGHLIQWGAARVIDRQEVNDTSNKPLLSARWAGGVDTVGGNILATLLRSIRPGGCVAACGLVGGADLPLTVYPFILRGASLTGIDSAFCPMSSRAALWQKLAGPWKPRLPLENLATAIGLEQLDEYVQKILRGEIVGRVLVELGGSV